MTRRKLKLEELNRLSVEEFRTAEKIPLTVVLDNVRSQHNIGSVFRTCDAFRVEEILLCGITATPPNAEIHKTALGAEDSVQWRYLDETLTAVRQLQDSGYTVYSVEQAEKSLSLETMELQRDKKYAVILGHEVHGVQQPVVDACDGCIEIPQFGTKHSLNVSVAAGIVIWDFFRQLSR
ncbi:MAG: RNA methyltransferase [Proteiniphilum sp.]|jgi:tRNA G18 (ribose-2'-O)-methylase SpoU|nr:RNA methyltransferase [Proteiniphilum sp.]MDD2726678.1 RNA methyltransferase [Proteiniphilum sp.]MDD3331657.1 RNA methyltransferase [Proteiniphilum sp.]MDD3556724.1 RNA methyltransferase [Proteiniphilum sp.]MDD3980286.1 RNA methyltransferase [Proteiniphilum sp.]